MRKNFESEMEGIIDKMFAENPKSAQYEIEYNWKLYLEYFLEYFLRQRKKTAALPLLLDVGSGTGLVAKELTGYFEVYGTDFSYEIVKYAEKQNSDIKFFHSSVYKLPFEDKVFDFVICLGVFQTIEFPSEAMREMARVLKPGGTLVIRTLNSLSLSSIKAKKANPDFNFYNPFLFAKEITKLNFKVSNPKGVYFFPKPLGFLNSMVLKWKIYTIFNLLFFISLFFAHSFYIEATKN